MDIARITLTMTTWAMVRRALLSSTAEQRQTCRAALVEALRSGGVPPHAAEHAAQIIAGEPDPNE